MLRTTALFLLAPLLARAADPHDHEHHPHSPPHQPPGARAHRDHAHPLVDLAHPIVTESPLPETKLRINYAFADTGGAIEHEIAAEVEYAFTPQFSLEAVIPYTFVNPGPGDAENHFNNIEVAAKLATYRFADSLSLLPAAGVAVVLPSGDDQRGIGSDHVTEIEPFLRVGHWRDRLELIATLSLAIPLNRTPEEDDQTEDLALAYNLSLLYHAAPNLQAVLELHGQSTFGAADDTNSLYLSPGVTLQPFSDKSINVGVGVTLPLTNEDNRDFDYAINLMTIFHL